MRLIFEWDANKARSNQTKHKVGFEEAKTVFNDPFLITFFDEFHSDGEERYISIGRSVSGRLLLVVHTEQTAEDGLVVRIISSRKTTRPERRTYEENKSKQIEAAQADMLPEYDLRGKKGVRGKYCEAYQQGHTVRVFQDDGSATVEYFFTLKEGAVMLEPDVREYFPNSESVNKALRSLIALKPSKPAKRVAVPKQRKQKVS